MKKISPGLTVFLVIVILFIAFWVIYQITPKEKYKLPEVPRGSKKRTVPIRNRLDSDSIETEVIRISPRGEYSSVKIKITNKSNRHINSCKMSCILYQNNKEIDVMTHYVIASTDGGLDPGKSTYFDYIFSTNRNQFNKVRFNIESIR